MARRAIITGLFVVVFRLSLGAQPATQAPVAAPTLRFDAASVKPSAPGQLGQSMRTPPGQILIVNSPLREIVAVAYGVGEFPWRIDGLPEWTASARFDIVGKAANVLPSRPGTPDAPLLLMLRTLLEERFKVTVHRENREMSIYELVMVKPGVFGPDLRRSVVDCDALRAAAGGLPPTPPLGADGRPSCGFRGVPGGGPGAPGGIQGGGIPLWQLVNTILPRFVSRTVVDRTGLDGYFDFQLLFSPPNAQDQTGGSIFTALQEQLGLKLQSTRGPVEVVVVDRIERPTPD